ncbi:MAG: amidohydrolase family protein [Candidatus Woesearchaeota archaeon]
MVIIQGTFVNHDKIFTGQVQVEKGIIKRFGEIGKPDYSFEGLIFPGMIDCHIHARQDETGKQDYKETYHTAGEAAMNGGVVAAGVMPNTPAPLLTEKQLYWHREKAKGPVKFLHYAAIGPETVPLSEDVPYKLFTGPSIGDLFFKDKLKLDETLSRYKGKHVSVHLEDYDILMAHKNESTHAKRRPASCVTKALDYILPIAEKYDINLKICHWPLGELDQIRKFKKTNPCLVEVSPLHLIYDSDFLKKKPEFWPYVQANPSVQTKSDRYALIEALRDGTIDMLATDHAPHSLDEKFKNFGSEKTYHRLKESDIEKCRELSCLDGTSGTPQLDTYGMVAAWLMEEHDFTPQDIARVTAYKPGRFMNQFMSEKFGMIKEGYQGCFTVLDMTPTTLTRSLLKTKVGWSPFEGMHFPGKPRTFIPGSLLNNY